MLQAALSKKCGTNITWWGPLAGSAGPSWEHRSRPLKVCLNSESGPQISHRISQLPLFLPDCPAQLLRPDLTSHQEGQEAFGSTRARENPGYFKKALI